MVDSRRTFYLSKRNKIKGVLVLVFLAMMLSAAAVADNNPGFLLFAIPFMAGLLGIVLFTIRLEISDSGIKYSDWIFTISANWEQIEKITNKGLLARLPEITFRRWALPFVWRTPYYFWRDGMRWAPESVRTIYLRIFEYDWLNGEIGEELKKYIPELIEQL